MHEMETSSKWILLRSFLFFQKLTEIPLIFRGIFRFLSISPIFRLDSGLYRSYIFEGFLNIFGLFPHFLGLFPVFKKSFKFSVWWAVFPLFGSYSSFFGSVSSFQKSFKFSVCWLVSSFFGFVSGFQKIP